MEVLRVDNGENILTKLTGDFSVIMYIHCRVVMITSTNNFIYIYKMINIHVSFVP